MILDAATETGLERAKAARRLEDALTMPLDERERAKVEYERWGESDEAIAEAARIDAMLGDV